MTLRFTSNDKTQSNTQNVSPSHLTPQRFDDPVASASLARSLCRRATNDYISQSVPQCVPEHRVRQQPSTWQSPSGRSACSNRRSNSIEWPSAAMAPIEARCGSKFSHSCPCVGTIYGQHRKQHQNETIHLGFVTANDASLNLACDI
jgi:hypothetical protein